MRFALYGNIESGHGSGISGTLPAAMSRWNSIEHFLVYANLLSGGPLPALPFERNNVECVLLDHDREFPYNSGGARGQNSFQCPLPVGATLCFRVTDSGAKVPITTSDCTHACTGASTNLAQPECDAWVIFFDALGGPNWTDEQGQPVCSGSRKDPCSCMGRTGGHPVCNVAGTAVNTM